MDAFESGVFEYRGRSQLDVDYDSGAYGLTDKNCKCLKKLLNMITPTSYERL